MNDLLVGAGAILVLVGCYLILPALVLVVLGLMLIGIGLARERKEVATNVTDEAIARMGAGATGAGKWLD